jgi:putative endonuclease
MFFVYALHNHGKDKIYIGHTSNLENRLKRHNGLLKTKLTSFTTKNKGIWELIYKEEFETRKEAANREKELKSFQGRNFIKSILKNNNK